MYSGEERWTYFMRIVNVISRNTKGTKPMKRTSRQKKSIALLNAKASLAIEGIYLTTQEEQLLSLRANGRLKNSEFLARALEMAKNV